MRQWTITIALVLSCCSCSRESASPSAGQAKETRATSKTTATAAAQATGTVRPDQALPDQASAAAVPKRAADTAGPSEQKGSAAKTAHEASRSNSSAQVTTALTTPSAKEWFEEVRRDMSPANDGWDTELFSERAGAQLKQLGKLLVGKHSLSSNEFAPLLSSEFSCTELRPAQLTEVFTDPSIAVLRPGKLATELVHRGSAGLATAATQLRAGLEDAADKRFKFKLVRVAAADQLVDTTCYFELSGQNSTGSIQRTATWQCRWGQGESPQLLSIKLAEYEEVVVLNPHQGLFTEVAASVFRRAPVFARQFRHGIDYWRSRLENYLGIYFDGLHGVSVADVNGDGLDDVYFCEPGGLPNRLFVQQSDGTVTDFSAQAGVDLLDSTRNALFVDLDNDGDQDLVLPVEQQLKFYANNGAAEFTQQGSLPFAGQTAYFLTAVDFDQDGRLDIYAGFYFGLDEDESNRLPAPLPLHDSRTGGMNRMLRNEGNWQFTDVTDQVGLNHNNDRWSFAAAWEDYDNDGDQDLYVANDFGRNNLYRNERGRFSDVAGDAGAEDMNFGMSATFGDYDRDGWMDLYVSNMFSAAGSRITVQPGFQAEGSDQVKSQFQRMVRGNTLLKNAGNGTFQDVSDTAKVTIGRWAWGSLFADVNNDGWEDLLVANGFVTGHLPGDL